MNRMIKRAAEKAQRVSKKVAVAGGVVVAGALTQASAATSMLPGGTFDTTNITSDITLVIAGLIGLSILSLGARKLLSFLGH